MRRRLTPKFVDQLCPPPRGEIWVADTAIPGFGIRAWSGREENKVFAIRTVGPKRVQIRKTICAAKGYLLASAREEAAEILLRAQGRLAKLSAMQRLPTTIPDLTLSDWVRKVLEIKARAKGNTAYVNQVKDLYANHADQSIGLTTLRNLTTEQVRSCIEELSQSPSQARKLQSFLHSALLFAGRFHHGCLRIAYELRDARIIDFDPYAQPGLGLGGKDFECLFNLLAADRNNRQLALFVAGVFFLGIRPKELLRAKWNQIEGGYFTPTRRTDWRRNVDRINIGRTLDWYFQELRAVSDAIDSESEFLFPSTKSIKSGHLTSYFRYWQSIRAKCDLPNEQLFYIARHFHNPLYYEMRSRGLGPRIIKLASQSSIK